MSKIPRIYCARLQQCVLDVRLGNTRARGLYERLGFVAQPRLHSPSARLPAELLSLRMAGSAQGIAASRAKTASAQKLPGEDGAQSGEGSRIARITTARQPTLS